MSQAAFRLESFSPAFAGASQAAQQEQVETAYRQGLAEGRAMGFSAELRDLTQAFATLQSGLEDQTAIYAAASRQAVLDLMPVLTEIVTCLAENSQSAGLVAALQNELLRLSSDAAAPDWHITCPPKMEPMIRRCADSAGLQKPDIRPGDTAEQAVIVMGDGRSAFSNDKIAQHFRDLISELQEDKA